MSVARFMQQSRKNQYIDYLKSSSWARLRKKARKRAGNRCEFCGESADDVHHVRYPKRFQDDHIDNLIVVCAAHHSMVHGKRLDELMRQELTIFKFNDGNQEKPLRTSMHNKREIFNFYDAYVGMGGSIVPESQGKYGTIIRKGSIETLMMRCWKSIHDPFKVEVYAEQPNGTSVPEKWLYEPGLYAMAGMLSTPAARRFQEWLYSDVLPSLRANGTYSLPQRSTLADASVTDVMRSQLKFLAGVIDQLDQKADKKDLRQLRSDLYEKVESLSADMSADFGQKAATARQYLGMTTVRKPTTENAKYLGQKCREILDEWRLEKPGTVMEGTFCVAMWPIDVLKEAVTRLGWNK